MSLTFLVHKYFPTFQNYYLWQFLNYVDRRNRRTLDTPWLYDPWWNKPKFFRHVTVIFLNLIWAKTPNITQYMFGINSGPVQDKCCQQTLIGESSVPVWYKMYNLNLKTRAKLEQFWVCSVHFEGCDYIGHFCEKWRPT